MTYRPKPIDTSSVELSAAVRELIEKLAESAHDNWAQQRIDDGWTYGPRRNDQRREHPCLLPYDQLPDSEKEYDRRLATETLKAIIALGYRIEKAAGDQ